MENTIENSHSDSNILLIETSTELCSVALEKNGTVTAYRESSVPKSHASMTAVFIDEVLKDRGIAAKDLSAVCVSEGPGSYTGLRVGVSTAKGLCFGAKLPLLSVGTLEVLVKQALCSGIHHTTNNKTQPEVNNGSHQVTDSKTQPEVNDDGKQTANNNVHADENESAEVDYAEVDYIVPMIDARRMEVYTAVFSGDGKRLTDTEAKIIDGNSFADILERGKVLFIGDGAEKCRSVITHTNALFCSAFPKASAMAELAETELKEKRFKDVAYFEPFYLKEFVATVSKKRLF